MRLLTPSGHTATAIAIAIAAAAAAAAATAILLLLLLWLGVWLRLLQISKVLPTTTPPPDAAASASNAADDAAPTAIATMIFCQWSPYLFPKTLPNWLHARSQSPRQEYICTYIYIH